MMTNRTPPGNPSEIPVEADQTIGGHGGWLGQEPSNQQMAFKRRFRLTIVALVFLAVTGTLIWQLGEPFQHIDTHILLMSGERQATDDSIPTSVMPEDDLIRSVSDRAFAPADFAAEDLLAFQSLRPILSVRGNAGVTLPGGDLRELLDLRRLQKTLDEMTSERSDVLMVYLTARTIVDDEDPSFEFNVIPGILDDGQSRLDKILQQISHSDAAVKLLIVDAGRFERNPSLGMVVNEFPRLLERAVAATGDASLWVLSSNRSLEVSHISRAMERSVFGWFVVYGLNGAADFNHDRQIDLDELSRFVTAEVSGFVQQTTGGSQSQIPKLLWGAGKLMPDQRLPVLLPVTKRQAKAVDDPEQWLQSTRDQSVGASVFSVPKSPVTFTPRSDLVTVPSLSNSPLASALSPTVPSSVDVKGLGTINANVASPVPTLQLPGTGLTGTSPSKPAPPEKAAESGTTPRDSSANNKKSDAQQSNTKSQFDPAQSIALAKLLSEAWNLRDEIELDPRSGLNPSVVAPEEWRRLVHYLLMQERCFRAAQASDQQQISQIVKTIRDGFVALSKNEALALQSGLDKQAADLIGRIQSRIKNHACHAIRPHSLGLIELFSQHTGTPVDPSIASTIATLDQLIQEGTANEFEEWVSKLEPQAIDFVEIRLARQLASDTSLAWPTKQFTLRVCRIGEKTASIFLSSSGWIGAEFLDAERLRKAGERTLLDQIGEHREEEGVKWLRLALPKYLRAASELEETRSAELLCDQLVLRLPQYVRWHNESSARAAGTPQTNEIQQLADDLALLAMRLDTPSNEQIAEIQILAMRLKELRKSIEESINAGPSSAGGRMTSLPGDQLQLESLLNTTLPVGPVRLALLQKSIEYDRRNIAQVHRPRDYPQIISSTADVATQWDWPCRALKLELTVTQLASAGVASLRTEQTTLTQMWKDLQEEITRGENGRSLQEREDLIWEKYGNLGSGLKRFYQNWITLSATVGKTLTVRADLQGRARQRVSLRAARRAQQLLPVNAISLNEFSSPTTWLDISDAHDLLTWHASRCEQQRSGAPRDDFNDLSLRIRSYRTQAANLPQQATYLPEAPLPIAWDGPTELSLETDAEQSIELRLKWTGAPKASTLIGLHYDPNLIEVKTSSDLLVSVNGKSSFVEPMASPGQPKSFELVADKPTTLRMLVRRRDNAMGHARLAVFAATNQGAARYDLAISLPMRPSMELQVEGIAGSWSLNDRLLRLHPFANHETSYSLSLINRETVAREVSLRFLAPRRPVHVDLPRTELTAGEVANLFDSLGPQDLLIELPKVDLPAADTPVKIPFPKPKDEPPAKLDKPLPPVAPHGMIVVVQDPKSGRSMVKRIEVAPQRPRRFLRPHVRYNADRERIEVTVAPIDRSQLPPEGVRIRAEIIEPLPIDAERELEGHVVTPNFEARLFVAVESQAEKFLTLHISVDDYPRAFIFRIPCSENTTDLPLILDAMAASITSPKPKSAYQSPLDSIPVELSIDAPDGAFQIPGDTIEVGIDRNNDRDFLNEPVSILHSDRQVEIAKATFGPQGQFSLAANVGDFKVRVPATGVRSVNSQLLARLTVSDRTVWSVPVPIIVDGAPPRVLRVRLSPPGIIAVGAPVKMTVSASDNDLSGVLRIEATLDTDLTGQFPAAAKPIVAALNANGDWEAVIPDLKPGRQTLLVRAVDRVDNVGEVAKVKLTVVSAEEAAKLSMVPVTVSGIVTFKEMLTPGVTVSAESADGPKADVPKIVPVETDDNGLFHLKGLVPGKWKIKVKGVVRNDTRTSEQEITIVPSKSPQPLKFILK